MAVAATVPSRSLPTYVLLALDRLKMKDFAFTNLGNIGTNNAGGKLNWGRNSFFPDGSQLVTDNLVRAAEGSSLWDLFANTYPPSVSNSVIRDHGPLGWSPVPLIDPLPGLPACVPGGSPVNVPDGGSLTIPAGTYTAVSIPNGSELHLTGGTYCMSSITGGKHADILVESPSTLNVAGNFRISNGSRLGPADGSGLGAHDVVLNVGGSAVRFSHHSKVTAILLAPEATVKFGRGGFFRGQFLGKKFVSDFSDTFTLEVCGNGVVDPGERCDNGASNGAADSCCTTECEFRASGASCADGDRCNGDETCNAVGGCIPGTSLHCADANPCTDDSCDPASGCVHDNVDDDTPCPNDTVCDGGEVCIDGTCTPQQPLDCDDGNACTDESCDPVEGCGHTFQDGCQPCATQNDCDDDNVCDGVEQCIGGKCASGIPLDCIDDANSCTHDYCDPAAGCQYDPLDGVPCDDSNDGCTYDDGCRDGVCLGTTVDCDDADPCTSDSCDPDQGCVNAPIPNCPGTLCTLTQGAYGADGGIANGDGSHGPLGWVTANPGIFPAFVGGPGTGLSVTVGNQSALIAFMPTGGTSNVLCGNPTPYPCPSDIIINAPGDVLDVSGTGSEGAGGGVLTGQALALTLSVKLSNSGANPPGLASLALPVGDFCTCGTNPTTAGPFSISACVLENAGTVGDLLSLANQALRGVNLLQIDPCLTYSDIQAALNAINVGFDVCRELCSCGG